MERRLKHGVNLKSLKSTLPYISFRQTKNAVADIMTRLIHSFTHHLSTTLALPQYNGPFNVNPLGSEGIFRLTWIWLSVDCQLTFIWQPHNCFKLHRIIGLHQDTLITKSKMFISHTTQEWVVVIVTALKCLTITVQNYVCAVWGLGPSAVKLCTDSHGPQRRNPTDFCWCSDFFPYLPPKCCGGGSGYSTKHSGMGEKRPLVY